MMAARHTRPRSRAALALLVAGMLALGGCSTLKGWFGGKSDGTLKPLEGMEPLGCSRTDGSRIGLHLVLLRVAKWID